MKAYLLLALLLSACAPFSAEVTRSDDNLTFTYTPREKEPTDYLVHYAIGENNVTIFNQKKLVSNVSAERPIIVGIPQPGNSTFSISMTIQDKEEKTLYEGDLFSVGVQAQQP